MSTDTLRDKKILFFSPSFFQYENLIAAQMRKMGAKVDIYDVRSVNSASCRALLKINPNIFYFKTKKYYENIIGANKDKNYDYILIVKCDMTPTSILQSFKIVFPHAKLCLYLWDSITNIPGVSSKFQYFDSIYSFDLNDCAKYPQLKFRPLFFDDQFRNHGADYSACKYDLSFLGTIHSDRYAVVRQIQTIAEKKGYSCFWFLYLQSKFIYYFYKLTKKEFKTVSKSTFSFIKMSAAEIAKIENESRAILDIQHPKQTGLTMRTIEMVGMNKKLITTNETIKQYDFYNPDNILIIDRKKVEIPVEFFIRPYSPIKEELYEKYSLRQWIIDVLS